MVFVSGWSLFSCQSLSVKLSKVLFYKSCKTGIAAVVRTSNMAARGQDALCHITALCLVYSFFLCDFSDIDHFCEQTPEQAQP